MNEDPWKRPLGQSEWLPVEVAALALEPDYYDRARELAASLKVRNPWAWEAACRKFDGWALGRREAFRQHTSGRQGP